MNEKQVVDLLKAQLNNKFWKILTRKYPSNSPKIREFLSSSLPYLPSLRPEIDMIFLGHSGQFNAVEVKFFKASEVDYRMVFYRGMDQALALFRYGFDNIALWHFFASDIPIDEINKYGAEAWFLIRDSLQLALNFSYFRVVEEVTGPRFQVLQYVNRYTGFSLGKFIDDPDFIISWRYGNPLILGGDYFTMKVREALFRQYFGGS
ncbi:MAG: hypothetical protein FJ135_11745 [Deltaproteobacteria bacterium]|nr:hypothetical protein [Deltaproteobacteria bacterium]